MSAKADQPTPAPSSWWRRELRYFIEIVAVAGFAVAQPLLSSFGHSPETFVTMGASRLSIVVFGVLLVVAPALLVWSVAAVSAVGGPRIRQYAQGVGIGLFVTLLMQWALRGVLPGRLTTVVAVALGLVFAAAYPRLAALRLYLSFASLGPVAFLVLFIVSSSVTPLVFPPKQVDADVGSGADQASVVVLVLDEFPTASLLDADNEIDAGLYPNLARLADDSSFYRNNTTVATHTDAALPAIMTGRYPVDTKAARRDYSENLFNLLGNSHDLNVHEAITALCQGSQCKRPIENGAIEPLSKQAWALWSDLLTGAAQRATDGGPMLRLLQRGRLEKAQDFIDSIEAEGDKPRLDFGHLLLPHQLWQTLPSGHQYTSDIPNLTAFENTFSSETGAGLARQRHLLQVQYVDRVVGRMLDRLEKIGRYDDSYVIVMADHGIAFEKGERYRGAVLTTKTIPEVMWVPLFVKEPRQTEGSVNDENTQNIDVVPTIADAIGVDIPWKVDGRSLLEPGGLPAKDKRYLPGSADDGEYVRVDGVKGFERMLGLPPPSAVPTDDPLALYRRAPYPELTGTRVEDLPMGPPVDLTMRIDDPDRYDDVDLDRKYLPVYVSGEIDAAARPQGRVVVSVNGVIGGWSAHETDWVKRDWRTESRFAVMVPESLLRAGRNTIEVFAMTGEPDSVTLHPVDLD